MASAALYNLLAAIERCHLDVVAVIAAPYAAGIASLSEDEATFGAVLDLRRRRSRGAVRRPPFARLASVPLGAQHVTQDLAFGLSTGRAQAERLKTLYGSVWRAPAIPASISRCPGSATRPAAGADRGARAPDRDHPAAGRGDLPAGAHASTSRGCRSPAAVWC